MEGFPPYAVQLQALRVITADKILIAYEEFHDEATVQTWADAIEKVICVLDPGRAAAAAAASAAGGASAAAAAVAGGLAVPPGSPPESAAAAAKRAAKAQFIARM